MKVLEEAVIPYNAGKAFIVRKGQRIRITGESTVDCVPFNLDNLRERFDQGTTKARACKIFISTDDKLYSKKFTGAMMTIVEDTYQGTHDLQYGMCNTHMFDYRYELIKKGDPVSVKTFAWRGIKTREDFPDHGCWENLQDALRDYNIAPEDIPSPFNIFQTMDIVGPKGELVWRLNENRPAPGKPVHVDLCAEINCLVALSACPEMGLGKAVQVQIFDE